MYIIIEIIKTGVIVIVLQNSIKYISDYYDLYLPIEYINYPFSCIYLGNAILWTIIFNFIYYYYNSYYYNKNKLNNNMLDKINIYIILNISYPNLIIKIIKYSIHNVW